MESLNDKQELAVNSIDGAVQILAGAGSGKTKVIINRIAYIIEKTGLSENILALTFTNKAANEMKSRLEDLLGEKPNIWIGTFHSVCLRILRIHIDKLGYRRDFVIYDYHDQQTLVKDCLKELDINIDNLKPAYFLSIVSSAKDELIDSIDYEKKYANDLKTKMVAKVYKLYQERLKKNNALDFDDIIFLTVKLLKENIEILSFYQDKFKYIMVDEYQDTNHSQYTLINLFSKKFGNICVVGDDDQAIYGWRGADIRNILDFLNDYPNAKVIKLEQNYRSTQNILNAANCVIEKNISRNDKKLWTNKKSDEKIEIIESLDDKLEAKKIADKIMLESAKYNLSEMSILYRTNAQSRLLEEALMNKGIPYRIYGGLKFYDRKEIKDILAYLKIISNSLDDISLKRIINVPKRNIGLSTLEKIELFANKEGISLYEALLRNEEIDLSSRAKKSIDNFILLLNSFKSMVNIINLPELIDKIILNTKYIDELKEEGEIEFETRIQNIDELKSVAYEFEKNNEDKSLYEFLSSISLSSDIDAYEENLEMVTLMTLHSSKGLEFPIVFISGMEEGIFPSAKSTLNDESIEEERRLCYVGMTRAKDKLYLSYAIKRNYFGKLSNQTISRFLKDIPKDLLCGDTINKIGDRNYGFSLLDKYKKKREMLAQITPKHVSTVKFELGEDVEHPVFGKGKIVAISDSFYTIVFGKNGIKKVDINFIKLKKLEE